MHSFLYQAVFQPRCLYQTVLAARRNVKMLSWARHIGHCLQLIYRAVPRRAISYSLVVRCIKDLNHLFVPVDTLSVRVYLSFRALYTGLTSLVPRGETRHDVTKPILYCRIRCPIT